MNVAATFSVLHVGYCTGALTVDSVSRLGFVRSTFNKIFSLN